MTEKIFKTFNSGAVTANGKTSDVSGLSWNEHASFKGVSLKHLVTGKDTEGKLSCHIVRILAGHEIGDHIHVGMYELHEVIDGEGTGILNGKEVRYVPGVVVVIPEGRNHRLTAGSEDLYILAKFVPALV